MAHDDIEIRLQDASPPAAPEGVLPESDPALCVHTLGLPSLDLCPVYFKESVFREIEGHAASYPDREVGGVLVGRRLQARGKPFVLVEGCIRGLKAEGTANRLTFTHDTWVEINAIREHEYPGSQIVGWYHTHPDLGVFMSRDDLYIHQNFFREEWQSALVVDPVKLDRALFAWKDGALLRNSGLRLYQVAAEKARLEQYAEALLAAKATRLPLPEPTGNPQNGNITVRLTFREPSLSPFAIMPEGMRRYFGIDDLLTAPRVSVKSLVIVVLLAVSIFLGVKYHTYQQEIKSYHEKIEQFMTSHESQPKDKTTKPAEPEKPTIPPASSPSSSNTHEAQ